MSEEAAAPAPAEAPAAESGAGASELVAYASGHEVSAFFNSNHHPEGRRYVKVKDRTEGFPLIGQSAGWLPATILESFDPAGFVEADQATWVHVQFSGTFRDTQHGHCEGLEMRVHPGLLRRSSVDAPSLVLSLFCVRWWDYWSNPSWSDWNVTSDGLLKDLLTGPYSVDQVLPGEYELHTAWVQKSQDLMQITGEEVRNMLRGPHISNWMFLWPTRSTTADSQPGCVGEYEYFAMTQRLERAGIPTGWPQTSYLYRQLSGRLMTPQMCLHPEYKVPATTRVHYAEFAEAQQDVADRAIGCLLDIRGSMGAPAVAGPSELRGVVKLGFSWCPGSNESFCGASSLIAALNRIFQLPGSNQIVCLLQEAVPDVVCEMRLLCFHDAAKGGYSFAQERLWLRAQPDGGLLEEQGGPAPVVVSEAVALEEFFQGSQEGMKKAEAEADKLAEWWQIWFCTECPEPPQYARFDFLVSYSADKGASVSTWEIGDSSSSLCGLEVGARNMATLNGAMRNDETGRFPKTLPPIRRLDDTPAA